MNTSALKTFAPAVRRRLMEAVNGKLDLVLAAGTPDYLTTYAPQVAALRRRAETGRAELVEQVAYTWFNRLAALRYLDARGWHPFHARVLMPASAEELQPELLKLTRMANLPAELAPHTDRARIDALLDGRIPTATPGADPQGEVYRLLVLAACRYYHALLPDLFERLDDATELLLPDDLLTEHSVAQGFRTEISDEDCAEVEILGWLYQFYISERKDQVMGRKSAVPAADIPAVTQLFTPHWIVRYLVENSLGRLWLLNRPGSRLREYMPYYIEGEAETDFLKVSRPEDIRLVDPAVGSGHMLTYAFDLLTLIYEEEGYSPGDIAALILRHNLYGLEICPRAAQLAELALVFKAREKSRRFFQPEHLVRPHIIELRDVRFAENELRDYIHALGLGDLFNQPMLRLLHQFEEAKNFGSLIQPCLDERAIADARRAIEAKDLGGQLFLRETHLKALRVLEQAEALTQRYHVVMANPPYMNKYNASLKIFMDRDFSDFKGDLFAAFIVRSKALAKDGGFLGFMTPFVWMFISSYENLRENLLDKSTLTSLVQLEYSGFAGATVPICTFTIENRHREYYKGGYVRLTKFKGASNQGPRTIEAIKNNNCGWFFRASTSEFKQIKGSPIAYWAGDSMRAAFRNFKSLSDIGRPRQGLATTDNDRFLRLWFEVSSEKTCFTANCSKDAIDSSAKWFPCQKGGAYRKWFGNNEWVVNWENNGKEIKDLVIARYGSASKRVANESLYFRTGITWSTISSALISMRYVPSGFIFETKGAMCFFDSDTLQYSTLGFTNSAVVNPLLACISPTLDFHEGPVGRLPIANPPSNIDQEVWSCVLEAKADWDNFETSWDFRDQPLLRPGLKGATLEASWRNWEAQSTAAIRRMQELETENNRLFIAAYGLDGELQPEVPEDQITLARADAHRDMAAFLSYAVGCMMGRYSLDHPGLILANAGDTLREYLAKVGLPQDRLTYIPDADGIIPVLDGEWFEDDIVARTREFLRVTFGEDSLRENLRFIEESLGKDLRKYFATDFYKDHLQTYKKRPIYWLVQSPRKGFGVLMYLHRYSRDTMNLILNRYLREYQAKLRSRLAQLANEQANEATSARDRADARKEADRLKRVLLECEEWERRTVLPLAQARIPLDLDDGVKVNYLKLGEALAPIPGLAAAAE